jgi:hypothetical protein
MAGHGGAGGSRDGVDVTGGGGVAAAPAKRRFHVPVGTPYAIAPEVWPRRHGTPRVTTTAPLPITVGTPYAR